MSIIAKLLGVKAAANPTTVFERDRLGRTMPGETAARAGSHYGFMIG